MLTGKEIRQKFIAYFKEKRGHCHVESSKLVPENPTVLLTNAGMLQFVPIFLGYEDPPNPPRAVSVQKCIRAGGKDSDIENVGKTPRHHTFFEMLGNFSFGDYFKKEIISWAWEFITQELKLPAEKLWITVYQDDDESFDIWKNDIGIPEYKIVRKGKKDNFWGPPGVTGPCGPCSEILYDLGELFGIQTPAQPEDLDTDRFVEIWNLVFMELFLDEEGHYSELKSKNIDTGMGLERITMALHNKTSTFDTDLIIPLIREVEKLSGKQYKANPTTDTSIKIIVDHARCITFMAADGIRPSNIGREYVFRMILRRASRHGRLLGMEEPFLYKLVDTVVACYGDWYTELISQHQSIKDVIYNEEERFSKTFDRGIKLLEQAFEELQQKCQQVLSGDIIFELYDTHGFPAEVTVELAKEQAINVDMVRFQELMQEQKDRSKQAHVKEILTENLVFVDILKDHGSTEFLGYTATQLSEVKVLGIIDKGKLQESVSPSLDEFVLLTDKSVFYGESGGQIGDTGKIYNNSCTITVIDTQKYEGLLLHKCQGIEGFLKTGDVVNMEVNPIRRKKITAHHSTAHLLQSALKETLGNDITQEGSHVSESGTRFDFKFNRALTQEELQLIEKKINRWIAEDIERTTTLMSIQDALKCGAIALFGEKYGDKVNVVTLGEVSKELCGGTHVSSTGDIRLTKIVSESSISAGVRRIEMVSGEAALEYLDNYYHILKSVSAELKVSPQELYSRVQKMMDDIKKSEKELQKIKVDLVSFQIEFLAQKAESVDHFKVVVQKIDDLDMGQLKTACDKLSILLGTSIIILASVASKDQRIMLTVRVSDALVEKGFSATDLLNQVTQLCDGKGGGNKTSAQGGAKDSTKIDVALDQVVQSIKTMMKV